MVNILPTKRRTVRELQRTAAEAAPDRLFARVMGAADGADVFKNHIDLAGIQIARGGGCTYKLNG